MLQLGRRGGATARPLAIIGGTVRRRRAFVFRLPGQAQLFRRARSSGAACSREAIAYFFAAFTVHKPQENLAAFFGSVSPSSSNCITAAAMTLYFGRPQSGAGRAFRRPRTSSPPLQSPCCN